MSISQEFLENKTVFVNKLDLTVGDSELYKIVSEIAEGKVVTIHVNRDQKRFDTSIAYINMDTHESASEVIKKLNGRVIGKTKVNVCWSLKDYKSRTQNETNLYFKGIRKDVKQQTVQEVFSQYGETLSVVLSTDANNEAIGHGYAKFVLLSEAEKVLSHAEEIKSKIGTENFYICKYQKQQTNDNTNIYVENIDKQITEEQFVKYFETFGEIRTDRDGAKTYRYTYVEKYGKCRGFINYVSAESLEKALASPKTNVLGEGELRIEVFKKKTDRQKEIRKRENEKKANVLGKFKEFNLYINTKKEEVMEEEIRNAFADCGEIYSLKVKFIDSTRTGVAFVCFTNAEDARKASLKAESMGWECCKHITRQEKESQNPFYPQHYMHPINFFQYLSMMPQLFFKNGRPAMGKMQGQKPKKDTRRAVEPAKQEKKQVEKQTPAPAPVVVTEDMKNDLGDRLYDYILSLKCDEELTGRITGVLLESLEYSQLSKKLDEKKDELNKIIEEVKKTLESM